MELHESHKTKLVLNVRGAYIRRTDFSNTNLADADLSHADASGASFRNSNFKNARLIETILRGSDLSGAKNLTIDQLSSAIIDDKTILPDYIDRSKLIDRTARSHELLG
ncbi:pentapeptide repeat-containing protein [Methylobacterium sp. sgz302541]|uniref:pentapeptide repeat-containing protein n=1 Tax=unclassified Methylobacterium TaxID=2615210 RepID=UPI003D3362CB